MTGAGLPVAISDSCCDAGNPVGQGCFSPIGLQAQIGLYEDVLDKFLVYATVSAEPPEQLCDVLLVTVYEAAKCIGIAAKTLADIVHVLGESVG